MCRYCKLFLVLLVISSAACQRSAIANRGAQTETRRVEETITTPSPSSTFTPTVTPTNTLTATPTPPPTATSTPTPVVLSFPLRLGTPLPPLSPIYDRWNEIELIAMWHSPYPVSEFEMNGYWLRIYADHVEVTLLADNTTFELPLAFSLPPIWLPSNVSIGQERISVADEGSAKIYDWDGNLLRHIQPEDAEASFIHAALSPDGKLLAYAYLKKPIPRNWQLAFWFYVMDVENGEIKFSQHGHSPRFSLDGSKLAVFFDKQVYVYDVRTGKKDFSVWVGELYVDYNVSPDGNRLAVYTPLSKEELILYEKDRLLHRIPWRSWADSKPLFVLPTFSADGEQLLVFSHVRNRWQANLFDVKTGEQIPMPDDCYPMGWQGNQLVCQPPEKSKSWSWDMNYLWAKGDGWIFGDLLMQHCQATALTYECKWDPPPDELIPPNYNLSDPLTIVRWWVPNRLLWTHTSYPDQSSVMAFDQAGKPLWQGTFASGHWRDGHALTGVALSPDRSLLALVGVDDSLYWQFRKPMKVMVRYLVLKHGVRRPPALHFETEHHLARWRKAAITFCGDEFLVVAVPGSPIYVYNVSTGENVTAWPSPSGSLLVGAACTETSLALLDEYGTLWLYGVPVSK